MKKQSLVLLLTICMVVVFAQVPTLKGMPEYRTGIFKEVYTHGVHGTPAHPIVPNVIGSKVWVISFWVPISPGNDTLILRNQQIDSATALRAYAYRQGHEVTVYTNRNLVVFK